jgi:hypothetical protein
MLTDKGPTKDRQKKRNHMNIRAELRARQSARADRKALERDLATYRTPAELDELHAMLSRYEEDQVADIRRMISRQRAEEMFLARAV